MTSRAPRRSALRLAGALVLTGLAARCDGTPLPEPPDNAPTPSFAAPSFVALDANAPQVTPASQGGPDDVTVQLTGRAGAADARAELWAILLDRPSAPVTRSQPAADGSFVLSVQSAQVGDRIRLVSRGPTGHSPALDLQVVRASSAPGVGAVIPEPPSPLACLTLSPESELTVRESATLTLTNACSGALTVEAASLRLGAGFALGSAPASIAPGTSATLIVANDAALGPDERGDVLLIMLRDALGTRARYALGVYAPAQ